ncbi:energy-coupling factor transporter transmembrane component T family protein [Halopenitus persicus]|uniref:Biotin transport system permease protein n=1 Tax=Halopenitus persicus TaxID=1048396 RepID=A0A1H3GFD5_9EURY|nr:energy-coupling factor transporter transmembrane component T [Halopenitus persicus]SDY01735.1 biotin transport system permease protein [Halopenitus persicus]
MTVAYVPDDSRFHRLDPRSKLFLQVAFAAAAYAYTTPRGLAVLSVLAVSCVWAAGGTVREAAWGYRWSAPFLLAAPVVAGVTVGPPWIRAADALTTGLASYRVWIVLLVAASFVRSTPVRESRAALQWLVPGRPGRALGIGVALVFRFLPLLRHDLASTRAAIHARCGAERSVHHRMRIVAVAGIARAIGRADRLATALTARCFAWNPTLPPLRFSRTDVPAVLLATGLTVAAIIAVA